MQWGSTFFSSKNSPQRFVILNTRRHTNSPSHSLHARPNFYPNDRFPEAVVAPAAAVERAGAAEDVAPSRAAPQTGSCCCGPSREFEPGGWAHREPGEALAQGQAQALREGDRAAGGGPGAKARYVNYSRQACSILGNSDRSLWSTAWKLVTVWAHLWRSIRD